jgi:hypothetical protein
MWDRKVCPAGGVLYHDGLVLEALLESLKNSLLMLLLDDGRSGSEDSECILSLLGFGSLAKLEKSAKQFGPNIAYCRSC